MNFLFLRLAPAVAAAGLSAGMMQAQTGPAAKPGLNGLVPGPSTCSTSGCHGGASDTTRQYTIWSQRDVHARSFATLTSARSARMAEALKIDNPATSATCTACHAPLQTVEPALLAHNAHVEDGVTCVSCHGVPNDEWLRGHTRPDWTHADRVAAGMRDLRDLYGRANACVACHQNIDPQIVKVGRHPQLIFELDGQAVSEPKHWREVAGWQGGQAWYVGQAVALREMSWAFAHGHADVGLDEERWAGLRWMLERCASGNDLPALNSPASAAMSAEPDAAAYSATMESADAAARRVADQAWTPEMTRAVLKNLAATSPAFLDPNVPAAVQVRRAERLILGLDRLLASLPANQRPPAAGAPLDKLFQLTQSVPDFSPPEFGHALEEFERQLNPAATAPAATPASAK